MKLEELAVHLRKCADVQRQAGNSISSDRYELEAQIVDKKLEIRKLQDEISELDSEMNQSGREFAA